MTKTRLTLILLLFPFLAYAGELKLSPEKPTRQDEIKLTYYIDSGEDKPDSLRAYVYHFSKEESLPEASETVLYADKIPGFYTGSYSVPDDAVFGLVKFRINGHFDDNFGNYWGFIVLDTAGTPLQFANLRSALSLMGNMPGNCRRNVIFTEALEYLEQENKLYPGNIQAEIGYISLKFDLKKISRDDFLKELEAVVEKVERLDNESETLAYTRALKALNQNDKAETIEYKVIRQYPKGKLAEEYYISELSKARSLRQFSEAAEDYLKKFPKSENREKLFSALVSGYLQVSKLQELNDKLGNMGDVPSIAYSQIANAVLQDKELLPKASKEQREELALKAVELAIEQEIKYPDIYKPKYLTKSEWEEERRIILGNLHEQKGWILQETGSKDKALASFLESLDLTEDAAPSSLYESLIETLKALGNDSLAYIYANDAIVKSKSSEKIENIHSELFLKKGGKDEDYISYLDSLKKLAKEKRLEDLKYELVEIPNIDGVIKSIDGKILNLRDLSGKITVISFWATWCGPCQSFLPAFNYLKNAYSDNKNIEFIALDVWEKEDDDEDTLEEFLDEYESEMPVYMDEYGIIPKQAGVTGLPVTIFIDENREIRFFREGFSGDNVYIQDAKDMIDFLKEK